MKGLGALLAKEWAQHGWMLLIHWGFAMLLFGIVSIYTEYASLLSHGFLSLAMSWWPCFAFVIVNSLSHRVFTLEQRTRTENFLSGLPVYRWHSLLGKLIFTYAAVCLVCFFYFFCVAMVSPQVHLNSWQAVAYPAIRLLMFNFSFSAIIFLVGMLGKFRWYIYIIAGFFLVMAGLRGGGAAALLGETPPFRLIAQERALGELESLPWNLIILNLIIGALAVFFIFCSDLLIRYWKIDEATSGTTGFSDRLAIGTGVIAMLVLCWMGFDEDAPSAFNLEYHLAFEKDAEVRSGETLLQLSYYKLKPANQEEAGKDLQMIKEMARVLEAARIQLDAPGWPKLWMLVKSPDASGKGKTWAKRMVGNTVIFVANWDPKTVNERESLTKTLARWNLDFYIGSKTFSTKHYDKHGWITSGLGPLLLSQTSEEYRTHFDHSIVKKKSQLEILEVESLAQWSTMIVQASEKSMNVRDLSYTLLRELETQLGKEKFTSWIREVADHCLAKPDNGTFSLKKGPLFWRALLFDYHGSTQKMGLEIDDILVSVREKSIDE